MQGHPHISSSIYCGADLVEQVEEGCIRTAPSFIMGPTNTPQRLLLEMYHCHLSKTYEERTLSSSGRKAPHIASLVGEGTAPNIKL
jgi:hypothetical protein